MHINIKVNDGTGPAPGAGDMKKMKDGEDADRQEMMEEYYESVMEVINNKNER